MPQVTISLAHNMSTAPAHQAQAIKSHSESIPITCRTTSDLQPGVLIQCLQEPWPSHRSRSKARVRAKPKESRASRADRPVTRAIYPRPFAEAVCQIAVLYRTWRVGVRKKRERELRRQKKEYVSEAYRDRQARAISAGIMAPCAARRAEWSATR